MRRGSQRGKHKRKWRKVMEETKILIGRLRTAAKRLKADTMLHTAADLLEEAADLLEKYDGACIAHIEANINPEILEAIADVSCEQCAERIRSLKGII